MAFFAEAHGVEWQSLSDNLAAVAEACGVEISGKRRTEISVACMEAMPALGVAVPPSYIPPWQRSENARTVFYEPKRKGDHTIDAFYASWEWHRLRFSVLRERGRQCECCGATRQTGAVMNVDHIKPLRKHWGLRLDRANLQVLCSECNRGKGNQEVPAFNCPAK